MAASRTPLNQRNASSAGRESGRVTPDPAPSGVRWSQNDARTDL